MASTHVHTGSCHCGNIKYLVRVEYPFDSAYPPSGNKTRSYKCNCTTCQKMGFFHLRPISPADDFLLLSPNSSELGDYRCFQGKNGWYFCKTCGVRPFGLGGGWVETEVNVDKWAGKQGGEGKTQTAWKTKGMEVMREENGKKVLKPYHYISVNAVTLDAGQEGLDLREWHEKGWVLYLDILNDKEESRFERPHVGGMY